MSIRPVDMGVIVQRTTEVDRAQQVRDQRAAVSQQQFGLELRADLERRETEVKAPPEAVKVAVNPDARRERKGRDRPPARGARPAASGEGDSGNGERASVRPGDGPGQVLDIKF